MYVPRGAAGGRSRVAVMAMGLYRSLCAAGGRSRVAVMPMGLCMYVPRGAARGRSRVAVMPMDAYGVGMYVCMCRAVPPGGAHE